LEAVRRLEPKWYKIASAEALDTGLVQMVRATGERVFVSLGMRDWGIPGTIPLWCVAEYPADSVHLPRPMGGEWGLSDHTRGILGAQLALARGATYFEKHLMLPDVPCADETFSLTPAEFAHYVRGIREAEAHLTPRTEKPMGFARRWVANRPLRPGPLQFGDVRTARANTGILSVYPLKYLKVAKAYGEPILVGEAE
jgi:pseudaminic acid synthase